MFQHSRVLQPRAVVQSDPASLSRRVTPLVHAALDEASFVTLVTREARSYSDKDMTNLWLTHGRLLNHGQTQRPTHS